MPSYVRLIPFVLLLVAVAGSTWADERPGVPAANDSATEGTLNMGSPEDREAIKKVIVEMSEGFNKHDAAAATRMYIA